MEIRFRFIICKTIIASACSIYCKLLFLKKIEMKHLLYSLLLASLLLVSCNKEQKPVENPDDTDITIDLEKMDGIWEITRMGELGVFDKNGKPQFTGEKLIGGIPIASVGYTAMYEIRDDSLIRYVRLTNDYEREEPVYGYFLLKDKFNMEIDNEDYIFETDFFLSIECRESHIIELSDEYFSFWQETTVSDFDFVGYTLSRVSVDDSLYQDFRDKAVSTDDENFQKAYEEFMGTLSETSRYCDEKYVKIILELK